MNGDLDADIDSISKMLEAQRARESTKNNIKNLQNELDEFVVELDSIMETYPKKIEQLLQTLAAMQANSEPDKSADYYEQRKAIKSNIAKLKDL